MGQKTTKKVDPSFFNTHPYSGQLIDLNLQFQRSFKSFIGFNYWCGLDIRIGIQGKILKYVDQETKHHNSMLNWGKKIRR